MLQAIKEDPERGMFCIDWDDDEPYEIQGYEFEDTYTHLDIVMTPCNYIHTKFGYEGDSVNNECIGDLKS